MSQVVDLKLTCGMIEVIEAGGPLGSVVEHSLHTRGVSSSNLLAGTNLFAKLRATLQSLSPVLACTHFRTHFEVKIGHQISQNNQFCLGTILG